MTSENEFDSYRILMEFLLKAKRRLVTVGNELDLTSMQTITLVLTDPREPLPMNRLCPVFGCDASNITGIVDGLERKKLVSRQSHPDDRRVKTLQMEPEGVKMRQQIIERLNSTENSLFTNLTRAETGQFLALIQKIAHTSS